MKHTYFPSIWLGDFYSKAEFDENSSKLSTAFSVFDWMDDKLLISRHPFSISAYCAVCELNTMMLIDWRLSASDASASIHPAWTETTVCKNCGLNSRMRALIDYVKTNINLGSIHRSFIAEQITPAYKELLKLLPTLVGGEYFGPNIKSGKFMNLGQGFSRIRHEDLTDLSFDDCDFDLVITQDVFEHIPDYKKAFSECWRILSQGGRLVFTIPFFYDLETTRIRAEFEKNEIVYHLPPEIHGNPISGQGSLCFQNFGWDILDVLKVAGFSKAFASMYWGPWQGHLGFPFFIFSAFKGEKEV